MRHFRFVFLVLATAVPIVVAEADQVDELVRSLRPNAKNNAELAALLLEGAEHFADKPGLQQQLYEKSYECGLKHRNGYATAIKAAEALLRAGPKDSKAWHQKLIAAYQLRLTACPPGERHEVGKKLIAHLIAAADDLLASRQDTDRTIAYYTRASHLVRAYVPTRRAEVTHKLRVARQMQRLVKEEAACTYRLKNNPDDHIARDRLICIYVVEFDLPADALRLLKVHAAEGWRAHVPLTTMDLKELSAEQCFELGKWYKGLSEKATLVGKPRMLCRSKAYYGRFLARQGSNISAVKARADLRAIEKELRKLADITAPPKKRGPLTRKFRLPARKDWTPIVRVGLGDRIAITAEGKWSPKPGVMVGPEGDPYTRRHYLQARIGEDSRPFRVGKEHALTALMDATLYLGMKDDWQHRDNSGFLTVTVKMERKK